MTNPLEIVGGVAIGQGVGQAVGDIVKPQLQDFANEQWAKHATKPIDPMTLASGVSQGQIGYATALTIASHSGINEDNFKHLIDIANVGPGVAVAYDAWRRDVIKESGFRRAVKRLGLEDEWIDDLVALKDVRLSPDQVANAVQQGHMPNPGILPDIDPTIPFPTGYQQPPAPDNHVPSHVPLTQINIDPITEAAAHGMDEPRLRVDANLAGLPPGPDAILQMWNRNLIDQDTVDAGIREGHMKTKWAHAFKRMRWAVLGGAEYAGLWLRGWITKDEAIKGGALTGHTPAQMELLYKNRGRPMAPVQAFTAWARKARHPVGEGIPDRPGTFDFQDFKRAIQQSDIRTEYVEPLWDIRYAYPAVFQVNRLVLAGAISPDTGKDWLEKQRYAPEVVDAFLTYWNASVGGAKADPWVVKAETQLWGTTHRTFIASESNEDDATARFTAMNIDPNAQPYILELWREERALIRKQLTPAQIKKAYDKLARNYATGAAWTRDDALAALISRGYSVTEANDFLNIPSGP